MTTPVRMDLLIEAQDMLARYGMHDGSDLAREIAERVQAAESRVAPICFHHRVSPPASVSRELHAERLGLLVRMIAASMLRFPSLDLLASDGVAAYADECSRNMAAWVLAFCEAAAERGDGTIPGLDDEDARRPR